MSYEYVIYEKKGRIAYITINRPEVLNALHYDTNVELSAAFDDFKQDEESWVSIMTGAGGMHRLPQQIPLKQAMGMVLTGRQITAQEAYSMGLVNAVVPIVDLMATAERWANDILECSPLSVRLTKAAVLTGLNMPVEEAMQADRPRLARLLTSEDFIEGPRAFAEKRKPQW